MLPKATLKLVRSLKQKAERQHHGLFVAEGDKCCAEILASKIGVEEVFATQEWVDKNQTVLKGKKNRVVSGREMEQLSSLKSRPGVLLLGRQPRYTLDIQKLERKISLALDDIQDPGNMGTIIRIADWFGIENLLCSPACADAYNNKSIQASMGSIARVKVHQVELEQLMGQNKLPVYGALLKGNNINQTPPPTSGIILIGNEGKGISEKLLPFITQAIAIPRYGQAESLNAAIATGLICAWARKAF